MASQLALKKLPQSKADYSLLVKRIRNALLHSENSTVDVLSILKNSEVWHKLEPLQMLEWASLSQMAGEIPLALDIYAYLTRSFPEFQQGWSEYLELLSLLNRGDELAIQVARAKQYVSKESLTSWINLISDGENSDQKEKVSRTDSAALSPFETMMRKRELMEHFLNLFSGREDIFARQWANKSENKSGYVPVRHAMTLSHVEEHLNGLKTYGIYLLKADSRVKCGVIDADINVEYRTGKINAEQKRVLYREKNYMISRIIENSSQCGIRPLLEYSGHKGYHFWYFFNQPVDASKMKSFLNRIVEPVNRDIFSFDLEVFPKQDKLSGKGFGNLVKLPLGIHRKNGKPSFFMECAKKDLESQLHFLKDVVQADPNILDQLEEKGRAEEEQVVLHPRMAAIAKDYPELFELERLCPPLGQVIATCREGRNIALREEKVLFQSIGFLPRARYLMHYLMAFGSEYNPHMVDFKLSKISGSPLGCRRIHSLMGFTGDHCPLETDSTGYLHPLLHLEVWKEAAEKKSPKSVRIENLQDALENMKTAILQLQRFIA